MGAGPHAENDSVRAHMGAVRAHAQDRHAGAHVRAHTSIEDASTRAAVRMRAGVGPAPLCHLP